MTEPTKTGRALGFARYAKRADVPAEDFIAAAAEVKDAVLARWSGLFDHTFLGDLAGGYADAILARDDAALDDFMRGYTTLPAVTGFLALIVRESVRLQRFAILGEGVAAPADFACLELGTFALAAGGSAGPEDVARAGAQVAATWLRRNGNLRAHAIGRTADGLYAEIVWGRTLAEMRRTCAGTRDDPDRRPLVALGDPATVSLEWFVRLA